MNTLKIDDESGLLTPICYHPSPYQDERPMGEVINMIVIHGISLPPGQFGSSAIVDFFTGRLDVAAHAAFSAIANLRVSAHLLIKRTGEVIQFVPFHRRAWHAGESFFQGRTRCNDFSIGIELEGTDDLPYELAQYQQLSHILNLLRKTYSAITPDRIVGHVDIAPGRKTDPGPAFQWDYLKGLIA